MKKIFSMKTMNYLWFKIKIMLILLFLKNKELDLQYPFQMVFISN